MPVSRTAGEPQLDPQTTLEALRPILENPAIAKVGQNLKYDMIVLRTAGIELRRRRASTRWSPATCSTPASATTTSTSWPSAISNHTNITIDELIGTGKNQKRMDEVPVDADHALRGRRRRRGAAADADPGRAELREVGARRRCSTTLEMPLIDVLVELEYNGIRIDVGAARPS